MTKKTTRSENNRRSAEFRKNENLDALLDRLNEVLRPAEQQILESGEALGDSHPVIFVMGPLRSGTTLFMQWLASTGICAYPTNLLSRFYGAPTVGALIQLMLTDDSYSFREELGDFRSPLGFTSENGKTVGALAPNEFWYFWRRFLPFEDTDWLPDEELFRLADTNFLVNELTSLTRVFDKPFALKGMILNYNIPFLDRLFEKALFVQMTRDPVENVASVLDARKRQYGDENRWYSFKGADFPALSGLDGLSQSAGQVVSNNRAIYKGMSSLPESKKVIVEYEKFCRDPQRFYKELLEKLEYSSSTHPYIGPQQFEQSRKTEKKKIAAIKGALARVRL